MEGLSDVGCMVVDWWDGMFFGRDVVGWDGVGDLLVYVRWCGCGVVVWDIIGDIIRDIVWDIVRDIVYGVWFGVGGWVCYGGCVYGCVGFVVYGCGVGVGGGFVSGGWIVWDCGWYGYEFVIVLVIGDCVVVWS